MIEKLDHHEQIQEEQPASNPWDELKNVPFNPEPVSGAKAESDPALTAELERRYNDNLAELSNEFALESKEDKMKMAHQIIQSLYIENYADQMRKKYEKEIEDFNGNPAHPRRHDPEVLALRQAIQASDSRIEKHILNNERQKIYDDRYGWSRMAERRKFFDKEFYRIDDILFDDLSEAYRSERSRNIENLPNNEREVALKQRHEDPHGLYRCFLYGRATTIDTDDDLRKYGDRLRHKIVRESIDIFPQLYPDIQAHITNL